MNIEYAVFSDKNGNRFIFPSIRKDDENNIDVCQCLELTLALGINREDNFVTEAIDKMIDFPHFVADLEHRMFYHGYATIWLIGGPEFEEAMKNETNAQ